ncbi:P-loop containing nucleoside triphosphate hydrolase protein, partial [Blastocladiella britannica]
MTAPHILADAFPDPYRRLSILLTRFARGHSDAPDPLDTVLATSPYFSSSAAILLEGPSGVGKSFLLQQLADQCGLEVTTILAAHVQFQFAQQHDRGMEFYLCQAAEAAVRAPYHHILVLDHIESFFTDAELAFSLMRNLKRHLDAGVPMLVVATTRQYEKLPAQCRSIVADTIPFSLPSLESRRAHFSLAWQLQAPDSTLDPEGAAELADQSHGWLFADAAHAINLALATTIEAGELLSVSAVAAAMPHVAPTVLQQSTTEGAVTVVDASDIGFHSVGGMQDLKIKLERALLWPTRRAAVFTNLGIRGTAGVLLYGPPGTGKTLLARAIAGEARAHFIAASVAQLVQSYVGESEKRIAAVFAAARRAAPCVVFLDEVDAVFRGRDEGAGDMSSKMLTQLLLEMDTCSEAGVVVLAATNHPQVLDRSLLRPGRLDTHLYVGLPSIEDRTDILTLLTTLSSQKAVSSAVVGMVAAATDGYSGADLAAVVRRAGNLFDAGKATNLDDALVAAAAKVKPSVSASEIAAIRNWNHN